MAVALENLYLLRLACFVNVNEVPVVDKDGKETISTKEDEDGVRLTVRGGGSDVWRDDDEAAHSEPTEDGRILTVKRASALEGVVPGDYLEA